jgi:hypothetical protein
MHHEFHKHWCFSGSSSKRHKGEGQRLGSSVKSIYVLCEACVRRVLLTSKHLYFHIQFYHCFQIHNALVLLLLSDWHHFLVQVEKNILYLMKNRLLNLLQCLFDYDIHVNADLWLGNKLLLKHTISRIMNISICCGSGILSAQKCSNVNDF